MVDAMESLEALLRKERTWYTTCDYLGRMQQQQQQTNNGDRNSSSCSFSCSSSSEVDDDSENQPSSNNRKRRDSSCIDNARQCKRIKTSSSPQTTSKFGINKHWREKICEWAFQVVDHFDLSREIVSVAVSHLDRYLSVCPSAIEKSSFQLLSLTCLYLAIKLNEVKVLKIPESKSTMDTLHQLSRGYFSLKEMEDMERDILQRLQWHVHPPTPQQFLKNILFIMMGQDGGDDSFAQELYGLANFQVELSVLDYYFASYKLSEIALASVSNALDELDPCNTTPCRWVLSHLLEDFKVDPTKVAACRSRLALIYSENSVPGASSSPATPTYSSSSSGDDQRTPSPVSVMDSRIE